jgi:hypothetical protein
MKTAVCPSPSPPACSPTPRRAAAYVSVQATVSDLANFPVSSVGQVVFHAADSYVGIRADYIGRANNAGTSSICSRLTGTAVPQPNQDQSTSPSTGGNGRPAATANSASTTRAGRPTDTAVGPGRRATTDNQGRASAQFTPERQAAATWP